MMRKNIRRKLFQAWNDNPQSAGKMEIERAEERQRRIKHYSHTERNVRQDLLICFLRHSNENSTVQKVTF
jgi:hypothetical protein